MGSEDGLPSVLQHIGEAIGDGTGATAAKNMLFAQLQTKYALRPIGGGLLQPGLLYRSAEICGLGYAEANALHSLGVRTIYDLRKGWEVSLYPEPRVRGVRNIPVMPQEANLGERRRQRLSPGAISKLGPPGAEMLRSYRKLVQDGHVFGQVLLSIAEEGVPALIHCTNGKDRVGVLSATLMRIAGASDREIMEDYLHTNVCNAGRNARDLVQRGKGMAPEELEILLSFFEARPEYLNAYFDRIDECYGSFEKYVEIGLGLGSLACKRLVDLCSTGASRPASAFPIRSDNPRAPHLRAEPSDC